MTAGPSALSMSDFGSELGADLGNGPSLTGQDAVQHRDRGSCGQRCAFAQRRLPQPLQAVPEFSPHAGRDVAVDPPHAWHLVAHALGLKDVPDAEVVKPGLVAVA